LQTANDCPLVSSPLRNREMQTGVTESDTVYCTISSGSQSEWHPKAAEANQNDIQKEPSNCESVIQSQTFVAVLSFSRLFYIRLCLFLRKHPLSILKLITCAALNNFPPEGINNACKEQSMPSDMRPLTKKNKKPLESDLHSVMTFDGFVDTKQYLVCGGRVLSHRVHVFVGAVNFHGAPAHLNVRNSEKPGNGRSHGN
jgi:hypothetical protein